jgi:hypothetical protein
MLGLFGKAGSLFRSLPAARAIPAAARPAPTSFGGRLLQGFGGIENASLGLGGLMYGAGLVRQATDRFGITPSSQDLSRMQAGRSKAGKNYTVGGIEYDFRSGRPINPPPSVFNPLGETPLGSVPSFAGTGLPAGQFASPVQISSGTGGVATGAGVPALRQNVQERALSQEVLNAAQQYSAPTGIPLSSFYEGQQQLGRSMQQTGELQRRLKEAGAATGMTDQALMQWAKANPAVAYREMLKLENRRNNQ